ncbi:MAG: hypothetical protein WDA07_05460 [Leucobacter sp.]
MSPLLVACSIAALTLSSVAIALLIRKETRELRRMRALTEAIDLATDALNAELDKTPGQGRIIRAGEVDPNSPLGRELIKAFGLNEPCDCPNCEEERRIKHANRQQEEK